MRSTLRFARCLRPKEMITPDDVRGKYETLNQAVLAGNWPTLKSARGKVIFLMDQRPMGPVYLEGHPSLRGRVLFTNAVPGEPDAAFTECNDGPARRDQEIWCGKGYLVRTRTDDSTKEARVNDTRRRDAMMASGAQILSTDYPASEPARWEGHYSVSLDRQCGGAVQSGECAGGMRHGMMRSAFPDERGGRRQIKSVAAARNDGIRRRDEDELHAAARVFEAGGIWWVRWGRRR